MRLIDADILGKEIKSLRVVVTGLRAGKGILNEYAKQYRQSLLRTIEEQPTAYDVDKVVGELSNMQMWKEFMIYELTSRELEIIKRAIKIVKQGGICGGCIEVGGCPVRDDCPNEPNVCEWKKRAKTYDWEPSCEPNSTYNVAGVGWFKYCPYCGKKIKVVE